MGGDLKGGGRRGGWRTVGHRACEPGIFTRRKQDEAQSGVRTERDLPMEKTKKTINSPV